MYLCVQVSEVSTSVESYQLHVVGYDTTIITGCWFLHMIFKFGKLLIFYMWKKYTGITNQLHFLNSKYKQQGNNLMNFMKVSSSLQTKVKPHMELYFYLDIVFFYLLTRLIQTVHEILRHWEIKAINNHITKWIALIIQKFN